MSRTIEEIDEDLVNTMLSRMCCMDAEQAIRLCSREQELKEELAQAKKEASNET